MLRACVMAGQMLLSPMVASSLGKDRAGVGVGENWRAFPIRMSNLLHAQAFRILRRLVLKILGGRFGALAGGSGSLRWLHGKRI